MKNIKNNNKSKARVFGTLLIAILVIAASFTVLFLIPQSPLSTDPAEAAWWNGSWGYKKKCNVANPVADYQMRLNLSYDDTLDGGENVTLDSHSRTDFDDIRFTNAAEDTELSYWIEKNVSSDYCLLWVNTSGDAYIYVYYGNAAASMGSDGESTFIFFDDFPGSAIDTNKWEGDTGDTSVSSGIMTLTGDGGGAGQTINSTTDFSPDKKFVCRSKAPLETWTKFGFLTGSSDKVTNAMNLGNNWLVTQNSVGLTETQSNWNESGIYTIKEVHWGDSFDKVYFIENGIGKTGSPITTHISGVDMPMIFNTGWSVVLEVDWVFLAKLSSTEPTWSSFGGEDEASSYALNGLTTLFGSRVTWSGVAGNSVYCNSSGTANEWPEINMTINATTNTTELRVWMDDLNDTSAFVNATNITMYVSSDNSSYGEMGTFTDGGSNCSNHINATNWNAGTMGADPFAGAGLTNKTASIWVIFKVAIPAGTPTDGFWSGTSTSFKVYIGHYSS